MMRALIVREAEQIAASGGLGTALSIHVAWLAAFVAVWGAATGTPLMPGLSIYEQLLRVQSMLLIVWLPWAAARLLPTERGDALVRTAARLGLQPSRLLTARIVALSVALACVGVAGLPLAIVAQRMSDVPLTRALVDQSLVTAGALAAATLATAWQLFVASRVGVWLATTASSLLLAWVVAQVVVPVWVIGSILMGVGLIGAALVAARGDVSLRYLSERTA